MLQKNIIKENTMNPESRIKLIRSLEEIRVFEKRNYDSRWWKISAWGMIIFYFMMLFSYSISNIENLRSAYVLIVFLPIALSSGWLLLRKQLNDKYKSLANAILELGSIAQENPVTETAPPKLKSKVTRTKKQPIKRKKK